MSACNGELLNESERWKCGYKLSAAWRAASEDGVGLRIGIENVGLPVIDHLNLSSSSWNESDGGGRVCGCPRPGAESRKRTGTTAARDARARRPCSNFVDVVAGCHAWTATSAVYYTGPCMQYPTLHGMSESPPGKMNSSSPPPRAPTTLSSQPVDTRRNIDRLA